MRKLCFHIQKGGVGKTSVSGMVACALARRGKKTLLIDCDPQANLTSWLYMSAIEFDLADALSGRADIKRAILPLSDSLSIAPSIAIGGYLREWADTKLQTEPKAFEFLAADIADMGFEYAIFDCSPSLSQLEKSIIAVVDEVINPLTPEFFSVDGIEIFLSELKKIERSYRRNIQNDKIVLNMINRSFAAHEKFHAALRKLDYRIFAIPQDRNIADCQTAHKSVFDYAPQARSIEGFERLTDAVLVS
jgi:cellulose biosynthesis protein BcsQ